MTVIVAVVAALAFTAGSLFVASGQNGDDTFYACLYAGSFSQINTNNYPANCGRGTPVSWEGSGADGIGFQYTVERHGEVVDITPGDGLVVITAECLENEYATGGGHRFTIIVTFGSHDQDFTVWSSSGWDRELNSVVQDGGIPTGWGVVVSNGGDARNTVGLSATVICTGIAEVPPVAE
ncbi:MAG TPA: hypothetical protein VMM78_06975 [Thermomicrobiales bacterium]|nr:hypothetical protein [Thermomicrobiales bacterium]